MKKSINICLFLFLFFEYANAGYECKAMGMTRGKIWTDYDYNGRAVQRTSNGQRAGSTVTGEGSRNSIKNAALKRCRNISSDIYDCRIEYCEYIELPCDKDNMDEISQDIRELDDNLTNYNDSINDICTKDSYEFNLESLEKINTLSSKLERLIRKANNINDDIDNMMDECRNNTERKKWIKNISKANEFWINWMNDNKDTYLQNCKKRIRSSVNK